MHFTKVTISFNLLLTLIDSLWFSIPAALSVCPQCLPYLFILKRRQHYPPKHQKTSTSLQHHIPDGRIFSHSHKNQEPQILQWTEKLTTSHHYDRHNKTSPLGQVPLSLGSLVPGHMHSPDSFNSIPSGHRQTCWPWGFPMHRWEHTALDWLLQAFVPSWIPWANT